MGDRIGIPEDPPRGLTARFYERLKKRPPIHTSTTYRILVIIGYIAACVEFFVLSLMYHDDADLVPVLEGLTAGAAFGLLTLSSDVTILRRRPGLELLIFVGVVLLIGAWMEFYVHPILATHEGDLIFTSFLTGWTLSSALMGNFYVRYQRMTERGTTRPAKKMSEEERRARKTAKAILAAEQQKEGATDRLVFCSVLCIGSSAGIMVYMGLGMMADPDANDMHAFEDWLGMLVWFIPMCAAVVVLIFGLLRMEARIMMFSGVLAGFSVFGFFAVIGQLLLWVNYKKYGLPWSEPGAYWEDGLVPPTRDPEDAAVRLALQQLREERQINMVRRSRRKSAWKCARLGVTMCIDQPYPTTYLNELRLAEGDMETARAALQELAGKNPKKYDRWLKEAQMLLQGFRYLRMEEEEKLGHSTRPRSPTSSNDMRTTPLD